MDPSPSVTCHFELPPLPPLRSTTVFGQTIRYYDVGVSPPLVLIHGLGGDADDWAFCLGPLSARHRVIAFDLLGFGRSDKPAIQYTIARYVEVLDCFLDNLKIQQTSIVGHSLGGWIAASFALKSPQAVDKLVLMDAAGVWGDTRELPVDFRVSTRDHLREVFDHLFYDKSLASDELIDFAYAQHLARGDGYTISDILQNLRDGEERLDDVIGKLSVPTLLLWGEQDEIIPLATGRRMHQLIRDSRLQIIPECGHLPELEKPAEVVRSVLEFLGR